MMAYFHDYMLIYKENAEYNNLYHWKPSIPRGTSSQGDVSQSSDILPNLPECTDRQYFSMNESRCIEVN